MMDVKFVPACEKALDQLSSRMEVCSLNRLPPDPRLVLCSGLLTLAIVFDVISSGNGGKGCGGAMPGSWLYMLFDLGNCDVLLDALGSVLLPSARPAIMPWEQLRCCPWNSGFGVRFVDDALWASSFSPLRSSTSLDALPCFCVPAGFPVSVGRGEARALLDLSATGVSVDNGNLTKGVPSARVIRRGNGQDCCGATGS